MKILAVDCADKAASCAIVENGTRVCESFVSAGLTHSRTLMPMIDAMLKNSDQELKDIDLFAVTVGPGSFTGLRIGVAAVKGMAMGCGKECVGVSTLHAIAMEAKDMTGLICAVMDARCNQVYNALFYSDGATLTRLCDDRALMCDELEKELADYKQKNPDSKIILVGGGMNLCYNKFGCQLDCVKVSDNISLQRAGEVAILAAEYTPVKPQDLLPSYLRLPQAERELKAKTEGK